MRNFQILLFSILVVVICTSVSEARIWHVEKDGSGDFTVIQDAVDAAESGDEILIGPGRFEEFTTFHEGGNSYWDVYVSVMGKDLSFLGSGAGETIIGPVDSSINEHNAIGISCIEGPSTISARGILFENLNYEGIWLQYGNLEVENCIFRNGYIGVMMKASEGGHVIDCHFENLEEFGVLGTAPTVGFLVEDCTFENTYGGVNFNWGGSLDCHVRNCTMTGGTLGRGGVSFAQGASGSVSNCSISDFSNYGAVFSDAGEVAFFDNVIEQDEGWGISLNGSAFLDFHDNFVSSNAGCIALNDPDPMSFHGNHFSRGEGAWFVKTNTYYPYGPVTVDMSGNWWGTTDLEELAEWTYDGNDNSNVWIFINYLPLADEPVSTESTTLGGLKALFRDATR